MKALILALVFSIFNLTVLYSQDIEPISARLVSVKQMSMIEPSGDFEDMERPLNLTFDGKTLVLKYDSGKEYMNKEVISFRIRNEDKYSKKTLIIIEIFEREFTQYLLIEKHFDFSGTAVEWINFSNPFMLNDGLVRSMNIYSTI